MTDGTNRAGNAPGNVPGHEQSLAHAHPRKGLERRRPPQPALLALADGRTFPGQAFGADLKVAEAAVGEVVFNTSMFGYQEVITDPSYAGQIMCFTAPHIGNVGCNSQDDESDRVHVRAVIVKALTSTPSNFRAEESFPDYLERRGIMGIAGLDTRALVTHLRTHGAQMGAVAVGGPEIADDLVSKARAAGDMCGKDYVLEVSCPAPYAFNELPWNPQTQEYRSISHDKLLGRPHVVAIDCGVKRNILRLLVGVGFRVTVVPAGTTAAEISKLAPDALFLSNGPGDPSTTTYVIKPVQELLGRVPTFGICLGHQLIGQAVGGTTYKLKFGHRGGNHPVLDTTTGKVEITVQNHGFAVAADSIPSGVQITHLNLNDRTVEGLALPDMKAFCIQYHPEASPGPHDAQYLFRRFFETVVGA